MHALEILRDVLACGCPKLHRRCFESLMLATDAALHARSHTLSNLARALKGASSVRHKVKRIDRLLGNTALQRQCAQLYGAMARHVLGGCAQPVILVDWSDLKADRSVQMIRASLAWQGRSLTLLEQVYAGHQATSRAAHAAFLNQLKLIVPSQARPIIVSDAGFRGPWFAELNKLGWSWLGRMRGRDLLRRADQADAPWLGCKHLFEQATSQPIDLGLHECVRSQPYRCRLVLVRQACQGRHKMTVRGQRARSRHSCKHARSQSEPWLLVCSLSLESLSAQAIAALYAQRMQIEQAFRDTKNARYGLGMEQSASRSPQRLAVLALIATLAHWVLCLLGQWARQTGHECAWQLSNRHDRPELSVYRLGWLVANALDPPAAALRSVFQLWAVPNAALQL